MERLLAEPELLRLAETARSDLRAAERLRERWPADLVAAATTQAELRTRAAAKFTRAERMLLTRAGLEQATAEPLARHRAARVAGAAPARVADLCCGIGGDLLALAGVADAVGVDRDPVHARLAAHNATAYDAAATTVVADVRDVPLSSYDAVFVDPARRDGGRRGGSEPPLEWCFARPGRVAVKAAPGLDRSVVPAGWEAEFVAVGRELREAVLWSPAWSSGGSRATVLDGAGRVHELEPDAGPAVDVGPPGAFLLDPSPAVTRAGLVEPLARQLGGRKIDERIAFLTADRPLRSPFGRGLRVEVSQPFALKPLAREVRRLGIGSLDVRRRGLAGDVAEIRRRLAPRGPHQATLVITRVTGRPWVLLCTDLDRPPLAGPRAT